MSNSRFGLRTRRGEISDIIVGRPAPGLFLLNDFPNAAAAYSLRLLRSAYTGSAIRVRRSNDNAEQDVGFVNNVLDTSALLTFVGANNGFVTTWYDQSGSGFNIAQTTAANQPRIVASGTLETEGGLPAVFFDGTNDNLRNASVTLDTYISKYVVTKNTLAKPFIIEHSVNAPLNNGFFFFGTSNSSWIFYRDGAFNEALGLTNWAGSTRILGTLVYNASRQEYFRNGILQPNSNVTGTLRANSSVTTSLNVLSRNGTSLFSEGLLQELVIYNDTTAVNQSEIENNILTYYGI
jgi:hypothetical protein